MTGCRMTAGQRGTKREGLTMAKWTTHRPAPGWYWGLIYTTQGVVGPYPMHVTPDGVWLSGNLYQDHEINNGDMWLFWTDPLVPPAYFDAVLVRKKKATT